MSKPTPKNHKKRYTWIIATVVATPLILGVLFMAFAFQIPQYSYYYVKCGFKEPVKVVGRGFGSYMLNYVRSTDSGYEAETFAVRGYFCTEAEAQRAGLKSLYGNDGWFNSDSTPINQVKLQ